MSDSLDRAAAVGARGLALGLGFVLLRSATAHAGNPYHFLSTVYSYQIVGPEVGRCMAAALPAVQIALALCLLVGWWQRGTFMAAAGLFAGFTIAQVVTLRRGLQISCGCFGAADSLTIGPATLAVAGGCAAAALVGALLSRPTPATATTGVSTCAATATGSA